MKSKIAMLLVILLSVSMSSCLIPQTKTVTVLVPHGQPVQLREDLKSVKVWVFNYKGERVESTVDLPIGWYCLPKEEKRPKVVE